MEAVPEAGRRALRPHHDREAPPLARHLGAAWLILLASAGPLAAQQVADTTFTPVTGPAAWEAGQGPVVAIDGAHNNFHTVDGRYGTFARVLRQDGFRVRGLEETFSEESLGGLDVLVIANALADDDVGAWVRPNPSAFAPEEIAAVRRWVEDGGALLLIADHMPFPGAAAEIAAAFGFELLNGFAVQPGRDGPLVFRRTDGALAAHPLTEGIDSVATFTGQALRPPDHASVLLTLPGGTVSLNPDTAWAFHEETPSTDVSGWAQGAVADAGRGRVAVFGEAAMFSAQLAGPQRVPMGMNAPVAGGNARLLVNLMRWLAGGG